MDRFNQMLSRRHLLVLAGSAAVCGCGNADSEPQKQFLRGPVEVGPVTAYPADGIYSQFRDSNGIFLIREARTLYALSAVCTHRACLLKSSHGNLKCPCHGSMFNANGQVLEGPATRDLPRYAIHVGAHGQVIVNTDQPVSHDLLSGPNASIPVPV